MEVRRPLETNQVADAECTNLNDQSDTICYDRGVYVKSPAFEEASNNVVFEAGSLVWTSTPVAFVLHPSEWSNFPKKCHWCFKTSQKMFRKCSQCQVASYCSKKCQKQDWVAGHQRECRQLPLLIQNLGQDYEMIADVLLLGRACASKEMLDSVDVLCWYSLDKTQRTNSIVEACIKFGLVTLSDDTLTRDRMHSALCRFYVNNFAITDEYCFNVGAGIYLQGSMVNHSCDPNCVVTFQEGTHRQEFRCIRPLRAGEEITFSYVDVATRGRKSVLLAKYHFSCTCERCRLDDNEKLDEDLRQLPKLSSMFSTYIDQRNWVCASSVGSELCDLYQRIYGANGGGGDDCEIEKLYHPMVGLHMYTYGDILSQVPGRAGLSLKSLQTACEILKVTHGEDCGVVSDLKRRIL